MVSEAGLLFTREDLQAAARDESRFVVRACTSERAQGDGEQEAVVFRCPRDGALRLPQFWLWCLASEETIDLGQRDETVAYLAKSPAWRSMSERDVVGHLRDPFGKNQASFDDKLDGKFIGAQTAGFPVTDTPLGLWQMWIVAATDREFVGFVWFYTA
jgi:hypothetical protein